MSENTIKPISMIHQIYNPGPLKTRVKSRVTVIPIVGINGKAIVVVLVVVRLMAPMRKLGSGTELHLCLGLKVTLRI